MFAVIIPHLSLEGKGLAGLSSRGDFFKGLEPEMKFESDLLELMPLQAVQASVL